MVVLFARESKFKVVIQTVVVCCCGLLFPATLFSLLSTVEESCLWSKEILSFPRGRSSG